MTRYRVGNGFSFRIDRSPNGGVWLDRGEWDALKSRNFHDELLFVFTNQWQKEIIRKERIEFLRQRLREQVGKDYKQVVEFKKWLRQQHEPHTVLAFLQDEDL